MAALQQLTLKLAKGEYTTPPPEGSLLAKISIKSRRSASTSFNLKTAIPNWKNSLTNDFAVIEEVSMGSSFK